MSFSSREESLAVTSSGSPVLVRTHYGLSSRTIPLATLNPLKEVTSSLLTSTRPTADAAQLSYQPLLVSLLLSTPAHTVLRSSPLLGGSTVMFAKRTILLTLTGPTSPHHSALLAFVTLLTLRLLGITLVEGYVSNLTIMQYHVRPWLKSVLSPSSVRPEGEQLTSDSSSPNN